MNLIDSLAGGSASALTSPLAAVAGTSGALPPQATNVANALVGAANRDTQMPDLADLTASLSSLAQIASGSSSSSSAQGSQLTLPPLSPMPAPAQAAPVATDDHGQSNIVLQDSSADPALIS